METLCDGEAKPLSNRDQCPNCNASIATGGIEPSAIVRCAGCGSQFSAAYEAISTKNRKATLSLVLGLVSVVGLFLTGIPAVILGIKSLADIKNRRTSVGRRRSIGGIIAGGFFGFTCSASAIGLALIVPGMIPTDDPVEIAKIQKVIGQFEFPETLKPVSASTIIMGMRQVRYRDEPEISQVAMVYYPFNSGLNANAVRGQVNGRKRGVMKMTDAKAEDFDLVVNGDTIKVTHESGSEDGWRHHFYFTVVSGDDGNSLMIIRTKQPLEGANVDDQQTDGRPAQDYFISQDGVKDILQSFVPGSAEAN